jgi:F0F1-type ATP synthase membrane subunit b/b'
LRLYAAEPAVKLAEQMIGRRLDDTSQRRLVSHFIAGLEATRTGS